MSEGNSVADDLSEFTRADLEAAISRLDAVILAADADLAKQGDQVNLLIRQRAELQQYIENLRRAHEVPA